MGCGLVCHQWGHTYDRGCIKWAEQAEEQPLSDWERELLEGPRDTSDVILHLKSGDTLEFKDIVVESVSPNSDNPDVTGIEFANQDRVVHVPFVLYWEFVHNVN